MHEGDHSRLDVRVLGPLEVRRGGVPVRINAQQQQVVLAALLLAAGRPVSVHRLIDLVWCGTEPRTARVTLQNYVRRLRACLDPPATTSAGSVIETTSTGYQVRTGAVRLDLLRMHDRLAAARRCRSGDRPEQALAHYRAALGEWRDDPLPELATSGRLRAELAALMDLHVTVVEEWAGTELSHGTAAEAVEVLGELARRWPLRERLRALLVGALHSCGRTADALEEFRLARRDLVVELGVEPGPELVAAQRAVLDGRRAAVADGSVIGLGDRDVRVDADVLLAFDKAT